jgi:hypothetical protein
MMRKTQWQVSASKARRTIGKELWPKEARDAVDTGGQQ